MSQWSRGTGAGCATELVYGVWWGRVGIQGGYTGGYTGGVPSHTARGAHPPTSDQRERAPPQAGWVGSRVGGRTGTAAGRVWTTLRARSGHPVALPVHTLRNAASWPIRRDSTSILLNLDKTAECHRKVSKRPAVLPISKTGP